MKNICKVIDDKKTRIAVEAERELIKNINGDCFTPIGAYAKIVKDNCCSTYLLKPSESTLFHFYIVCCDSDFFLMHNSKSVMIPSWSAKGGTGFISITL